MISNATGSPALAAQNVGAHWRLNGSLKEADAFPFDTLTPYDAGANSGSVNGKRNHAPVVVVRRKDTLSPLILAAKTAQFVIPLVTVTTNSGQKVNLTNARVTNKTDSFELEEIELTFQKIQITWSGGKKSGRDDWDVKP